MKRSPAITATTALLLSCVHPASHAAAQSPDWTAVEAAIGRAPVVQPGDVYRFNFPRSDMHVMVDGVELKPALALGGWISFKAIPGGAMIMGDLVLAGDEVTPVVARLQAGGIEQTAIHHHVIRESPRVYYVHVSAHGDAMKLAETIRASVALTKIPGPAPSAPAATPGAASAPFGIDTTLVAAALGYSGRVNGGVYQVSVPRMETIRDGGMEIPASMGLGTAINFQPTGGGKAAITGDFVLTAAEVNVVIRTLGANGIESTSLHNHMLTDEPRLFFMHFWANDDAVKLARGLRAALDKTNSRPPAK